MIHNQDLGFSDFENNLFNYEGDNEDAISVSSDSEEVIEVDSVRPQGGLDEDDLRLGGDSDEVGEVARRAAKSVNQSTNPQAEGGASSSQPPTQSQVTMLLD
ncbi:hypothetical protein LWI29_003635 [Acer saccharum]|uniref:Uncharacterized protein n=1 Tax=Acer saccharum TaxID=4024 RepID=A0AA39VGR5_ACESA|nr:hypothetical protein LWI29_003635 [Acer saccharum]